MLRPCRLRAGVLGAVIATAGQFDVAEVVQSPLAVAIRTEAGLTTDVKVRQAGMERRVRELAAVEAARDAGETEQLAELRSVRGRRSRDVASRATRIWTMLLVAAPVSSTTKRGLSHSIFTQVIGGRLLERTDFNDVQYYHENVAGASGTAK